MPLCSQWFICAHSVAKISCSCSQQQVQRRQHIGTPPHSFPSALNNWHSDKQSSLMSLVWSFAALQTQCSAQPYPAWLSPLLQFLSPPPPSGWRTVCCGDRNCCGCCLSKAVQPLGGIELGLSTWNMNFTSRKCLYPHSFTLPMVRCNVQKVGQKAVDFHGNGMCLYYTVTPWFRGNCLKIGLLYLVKQELVAELWNYISSYVSLWKNSKSHRKLLSGVVRFGSLRRVSQVTPV